MVNPYWLEPQKKEVSYQQANPLDRWVYQWLLEHLESKYDKDHLLYMDEAGISATDCYQWGWSKKGIVCDIARLGGRGQRRNFISAIRASDKDWREPWVIKGTINRAVFTQWLTALGESL